LRVGASREHPLGFELNGHTDVFVPNGNEAELDDAPFGAEIKDGQLCTGAAPPMMKSGVAAFTAAAIDF